MSFPTRRVVVGASALALLTLLAYVPALQGGFIWDDDRYATANPTLTTFDGLRRIWFEIGATIQYYPLVFTSFWIERHLGFVGPAGYHLDNVLLHAASAVVLWRILHRLSLPAAWVAAAVFALHPVHVESVAWITERKNVLSGLFCLCSLFAYLGFEPPEGSRPAGRRAWGLYALAFVLFVCALLSKTVTCSLPAVILVLLWWRRGRVGWRDIRPLLPFLAIGIALGLTTAWMEKHSVGARGGEWAFSIVDRCLIAGRALWFYVGKLLWPVSLTFIYPRWTINSGVWWQYIFPVGALSVIVLLFVLRNRIGRGPLAAVLIFAGTLFPALGFVNTYPMRYSFVADHFQYLASIPIIVGAAAIVRGRLTRTETRSARGAKAQPTTSASYVLAGGVLTLLIVLTLRQGFIYASLETLWNDTLAKNPGAWIAHNNLGNVLNQQGRTDEACAHYRKSIELNRNNAEAHVNLGVALASRGDLGAAIACYWDGLAIKPDDPTAHSNLGAALAALGNTEEAIVHYRAALRSKSDDVLALNNLGIALAAQGKIDEAIGYYQAALRYAPEDGHAHLNLGVALAGQGKLVEAIDHYRVAMKVMPEEPVVRNNLAAALAGQGKSGEAIMHLRASLQIRPNDAGTMATLAWQLATNPSEGLREGREAMRLAQAACEATGYNVPRFLYSLAAACAETGGFEQALEAAGRARELAASMGDQELRREIEISMQQLREHRPIRQDSPRP